MLEITKIKDNVVYVFGADHVITIDINNDIDQLTESLMLKPDEVV